MALLPEGGSVHLFNTAIVRYKNRITKNTYKIQNEKCGPGNQASVTSGHERIKAHFNSNFYTLKKQSSMGQSTLNKMLAGFRPGSH